LTFNKQKKKKIKKKIKKKKNKKTKKNSSIIENKNERKCRFDPWKDYNQC